MAESGREEEEVIPVITTTVLMTPTNDAAPFNPSNNHLYCYPWILFALRYIVSVMHINAGTLGEIVGRTCTLRERCMRKNVI